MNNTLESVLKRLSSEIGSCKTRGGEITLKAMKIMFLGIYKIQCILLYSLILQCFNAINVVLSLIKDQVHDDFKY